MDRSYDLDYRPRSYWEANESPRSWTTICVFDLPYSVLADALFLQAREGRDGQILYRLVDCEGSVCAKLHPPHRRGPLTLGELIELIDTADMGDEYRGIPDSIRDENLEGLDSDDDPAVLLDFVQVSSDLYPMLQDYYRAEAEEWLEAVRAERAIYQWLDDEDEELEEDPSAEGRRERPPVPPELLNTLRQNPRLLRRLVLQRLLKDTYSALVALDVLRSCTPAIEDRRLRLLAHWCARQGVKFLNYMQAAAYADVVHQCCTLLRTCARYLAGKASRDQLVRSASGLELYVPRTEIQTMFGRRITDGGYVVRACLAVTLADPWMALAEAISHTSAAFQAAERVVVGVTPEKPQGDEQATRQLRERVEARRRSFAKRLLARLRELADEVLTPSSST